MGYLVTLNLVQYYDCTKVFKCSSTLFSRKYARKASCERFLGSMDYKLAFARSNMEVYTANIDDPDFEYVLSIKKIP